MLMKHVTIEGSLREWLVDYNRIPSDERLLKRRGKQTLLVLHQSMATCNLDICFKDACDVTRNFAFLVGGEWVNFVELEIPLSSIYGKHYIFGGDTIDTAPEIFKLQSTAILAIRG